MKILRVINKKEIKATTTIHKDRRRYLQIYIYKIRIIMREALLIEFLLKVLTLNLESPMNKNSNPSA